MIWDVGPDCRWCRPTITACCRCSSTWRATASRRWSSRERREVRISASLESDLVVVRFRDTGPGVAHPEELFRPFQPGAQSFGLGLYISRAILRSHGGGLRYEPQDVRQLFCRRAVARGESDGSMMREPNQTGRSASCWSTITRCSARASRASWRGTRNCVVEHCGSIREALALLAQRQFDLVLLDHDLGGGAGVAVSAGGAAGRLSRAGSW